MGSDYAREQLLKARTYAERGQYRLAKDCAQRAIDSLDSLIANELTDEEMTAE